MTTPSPAEHLSNLLHQAVREAALLESALERESTALASRNADTLSQVVAEKHQLVRSLEQITREQTDLLRAGGFAADGAGMEACLRAWDPEDLARPAWARLQEVMDRCRRLNRINGGVVDLHRRQTQQAIHILRGETPHTELYDPRGHTVSSGPSRHISKA